MFEYVAGAGSPTKAMRSVDSVVSRVAQQASTWKALDARSRADILQSCRDGVFAVAEEWVKESCEVKGIAMDSSMAGEEWITGPAIVLRHLRQYRDTLLRGGCPHTKEKHGVDGWKIKAFPLEPWDRILFPGLRAEIYGKTKVPATALTLGAGGCSVVLGAGNVTSIPPLDILWQLLKENRVVIAKLHPLQSFMRPLLERAFAPLHAAGFLGFVDGDSAVGEDLIAHPKVDAIHLTGSEASFRRIVKIPAVEQKEISAELGAVSPVIVVPGVWSKSDICFQAEQLVGMMLLNNGFNCNSPQLLVTARDWPQRQEFLQAIRDSMQRAPARVAWYPGASQRWSRFLRHYQASAPPHSAEQTPPLLLADIPAEEAELALREEAFCSVLVETSLPASKAEPFLSAVVSFVNQQVYGTLSCTVIAAPSTPKQALQDAVEQLQYGTIGVNIWAGLGFALASLPWGAYPGHTKQIPGSGMGVVHNTLLLDSPRNTILRGPFRPKIKPMWMPQHRRLHILGQRLLAFEHDPSWGRLLRLLPPAILG